MHHIFFIHLSVDGHVDGFHLLVIVNNAVIRTDMRVTLWYADLESLGIFPVMLT